VSALALAFLSAVLPISPIGATEKSEPASAPSTSAEARTDALVDTVSAAWFKAEWHSYADRFVTADGRVVDNANGNISHSEGQGYGLLLAARAGDADRFDTLWQWTHAHLLVRGDGLAAWKWDSREGRVTDVNNATDGDILIAWALWDGARRFNRPDYRRAAERLARNIGSESVKTGKAGPFLLPGVKGFGPSEQPDGPVINLSYWVFPAFAALKELAPETDWDGLKGSGMALLDASRFGSYGLPTEWESITGPWPRPAQGFPALFGYNAIRIPLYLALDRGAVAQKALHRFAGAWTRNGLEAHLLNSKVAAIVPPIEAPGYDLVLAVARCATAGEAIPPEMINTRSDLYYPETLRLLSVVALQERYPACL
jgi:endo-1,4-beta-D-glucanase Y